MKYIVYETPAFLALAEKYNCLNEIKKLKEKVEKEQSIGTFERYLPSPFIRKYVGSNFRLIASEKLIDDNNFICFLKILPRGSKEYKDWLNNLDLFNDQIPSDSELMKEITNLQKTNIPSLKNLDDSEYEFLMTIHPESADSDEIIIESNYWVETINEKDFEYYKLQILELLYEVVQIKPATCELQEITDIKKSVAVNYKYYPDFNKYFLIAPRLLNKNDDQNKLLIEKACNELADVNSIKQLIQLGRKSYPSYILIDQDIWFNIQKHKEGNLALSPEENAILEKIRKNNHESPRYPIFINGRPGSGKSTILQYLFSDIIHHVFSHLLENKQITFFPLYLTYNDNLLNVAKKTIKIILKCNADKVSTKTIDLNTLLFIENFEKCFQTFQNLLLSFLNENELSKFSNEKYVDFSRFKEFWFKDIPRNPDPYMRKKLNPETAWHVIRTYIKGMSFSRENDFDDEAYRSELARDQKTISDELFKNIYEKVWKGWYKPLLTQNSFWDDQDLARYIIDSHKELANYSAVFCDEAQDFTKIELEIIINLSYFKKRTIPSELIKNIPFAFAGDPFQTLNPTGFNWESVKANFHEKIIKELDKSSRPKLQLNYFELEENYRSTKPIVGFSNVIQLLRGVLFNIKNLVPQKTWYSIYNQPPQFFYNNTHTIEEEIKGQEEIVIIIPCQSGEELNWIKSDPLLRDFAIGDDGNISRNILSPMRAKGLEFNRVVLYNFGNQAAIDYGDFNLESFLYEDDKAILNKPEEQLRFEFFINNLYVGASRPKYSLLIVDSRKGYEFFWGTLRNNYLDLLEHYSSNFSTLDIWSEDYVTIFEEGSSIAWGEHKDEPLLLARSFEKQGVQTKNIDDLKLAEQNYNRAKNYNEEKRVKALRLYWSKSFEDSGDLYKSLGLYDEALGSYWDGKIYAKIQELTKLKVNLIYRPQANAAEYMLEPSDYDKAQKFLNQIYDHFQNRSTKQDLTFQICNSSTWPHVLKVLVTNLSKFCVSENNETLSRNINYRLSNSIENLLGKDSSNDIALIKYYDDYKQEAILQWESNENNKYPKEYYIAKSEVTSYPEKLNWLDKLNNSDAILFTYGEHKNEIDDLTEDLISIIIKVIVQNNMKEDFLFILQKVGINKVKSSFLTLDFLLDVALDYDNYELIASYLADNFTETQLNINLKSLRKKDPQKYLIINLALYQKIIQKDSIKDMILFVNNLLLHNNDRKEEYSYIFNCITLEYLKKVNHDTIPLDKFTYEEISKYLCSNYISHDKTKEWDPKYDFYTVLIAFEKFGKIIDALNFYESIYKNENNEEDLIKLSKERWVKQKIKQYEKNEKNEKYEKHNNQKNKEEAQSLFKEWGIVNKYDSIKEIPEYKFYYEYSKDKAINGVIASIIHPTKKITPVEKGSSVITDSPERINEIKKYAEGINSKSFNYEFIGQLNLSDKIKYEIEHKPLIYKTRIKYVSPTSEELVSILHDKKTITGEVEFIHYDGSTDVYFNNDWNLFVSFYNGTISFSYNEIGNVLLSLKIREN
ncbi:MAG: hypothetical protein KF816_06295 [Melioribacteraceae bacterium]|nr:hypothetical protein [Melioribacteraceae bacterium]